MSAPLNGGRCPGCGADLERQAFNANKGAGDVIRCAKCHQRFSIEEHTNGWQDWMTFAREIG